MTNKLEKILLKMYSDQNDRFYSHLFFGVDRVKSKQVPTMGVGVQEGRLKLYYNEEFMDRISNEFSEDHVITVLKHETKHIINKHLSDKKVKNTSENMIKHMMENIAMDCAINQGATINEQHIVDIGGITLESFTKMLKHKDEKFKLKDNQSWYYYMDLLEKEKEEREKNGEGTGDFEKMLGDAEMDDHGNFNGLDPLEQAMVEGAIKNAADKVRADNAGSLPSDLEEMLKILKKPTISWKRQLLNFIGYNTKADRRKSRMKRNRRLGIKFAGWKSDYKAKILVGLDVSGSMTGDRTQKALSEIYGIYRASSNLEIDIAEADTQIQDVFTYTGKDEFKITGRGGTCLLPLLKYGKEKGYDAVIVLTDGEYSQSGFNEYKDLQSLFVIVGNEGFTSEIGKTVHVPAKGWY